MSFENETTISFLPCTFSLRGACKMNLLTTIYITRVYSAVRISGIIYSNTYKKLPTVGFRNSVYL